MASITFVSSTPRPKQRYPFGLTLNLILLCPMSLNKVSCSHPSLFLGYTHSQCHAPSHFSDHIWCPFVILFHPLPTLHFTEHVNDMVYSVEKLNSLVSAARVDLDAFKAREHHHRKGKVSDHFEKYFFLQFLPGCKLSCLSSIFSNISSLH